VKSLIIEQVNITTNSYEQLLFGSGEKYIVEGPREINWKGRLNNLNETDDLEKLMEGNNELESLEWLEGCLIKLHITNVNISSGPGQPYTCEVEGIASDYKDRIEIQFADCKVKVPYKVYNQVKKGHKYMKKLLLMNSSSMLC